jgi:hypothetical protein
VFCLVQRLGIDPVMLSHPHFFLFLVRIGVAEDVVATSKLTLVSITASALGEGDISRTSSSLLKSSALWLMPAGDFAVGDGSGVDV